MSYRPTIARQPEALANTYAAIAEELPQRDITILDKSVVGVTGIGASYAAAVVVADQLQHQGRRAFAIRSCDMAFGFDLCDALIGLSHRGRSVETVEALQRLPGAARLAITQDAESPLAEAANVHIRLANGSDATPSSTGYTATLLGAGMVVDKLVGTSTDWAGIPATVSQTLELAASKMGQLREQFVTRRAIDCVGAGASLGTADGASLLIREAARLPASAYDTRHYLHGPLEAMDASTGIVIFGNGREVELARQADKIGCPTLLVTTADGIEDGDHLTVVKVAALENRIAQGIVDILTAQLFAAELSDAAGLTDVKFRYRMSDTKVPVAA